MKDHLEIDRFALGKSSMDYLRRPEPLNSKISANSRNEVLKTGGVDYYDETVIEEMDFSKAVEYLAFIRGQAQIPGGRQMMSFAHQHITPRQVSQMF